MYNINIHVSPPTGKWCGPSGQAALTVNHLQNHTLLANSPPANHTSHHIGLETHSKRQMIQHGYCPACRGNGDKGIEIVHTKEKNLLDRHIKPTKQPRKNPLICTLDYNLSNIHFNHLTILTWSSILLWYIQFQRSLG